MKLVLAIAQVAAVTNLMLKHGSGEDATLVPGKCLSFRAQIKAPRVPSIPELDGAIGWKTEYESGTLKLDLSELNDLDFEDDELVLTGVNAKAITFTPLATGMVDLTVNAIVELDDPELRGKLDAILRHTVKATFLKLTQKPLAAPKTAGDDAADTRQPALEGLH
jgi:hypothetical protein